MESEIITQEKTNVEEKEKYDAHKGLHFGMDVLMKVSWVLAIIYCVLAALLLISGIVLCAEESTSTLGTNYIVYAILLVVYAILLMYTSKKYKSYDHNFSINFVVLTMFVNLPCAVLMIVDRGFHKE